MNMGVCTAPDGRIERQRARIAVTRINGHVEKRQLEISFHEMNAAEAHSRTTAALPAARTANCAGPIRAMNP